MKLLIFLVLASTVSFSSLLLAAPKMNMNTHCFQDTVAVKDVGLFPRRTPQPEEPLFATFNNLTSTFTQAHEDCKRETQISGSNLSNVGESCIFPSNRYGLELDGDVFGEFKTSTEGEITMFEDEVKPKLHYYRQNGDILLSWDVTQVGLRKIKGKYIDEIIVEGIKDDQHSHYLIIDVATVNI